MNTKRFMLIVATLLAVLALAACGGGAPAPLDVTIKGSDIKFETTTITAKVGQTVNVTFENVGALEHSFIIADFNVKLEKVQAGQKATATFVADKAGTFEFVCDVAGHKEAGMVGKLTVNP